VGANSVTNYYDAAGNVTNRVFANGRGQVLTWDAAGRLVSVIERVYSTNGFNWAAIYDALGRRLRTTQVPVVNGAALIRTHDVAETVDSTGGITAAWSLGSSIQATLSSVRPSSSGTSCSNHFQRHFRRKNRLE